MNRDCDYIAGNLAVSESNAAAQILPQSSSLLLQGENQDIEEKSNCLVSASSSTITSTPNQTKNFGISKRKSEFEKLTVETIALYEKRALDLFVSRLSRDIQNVISQDEFIDGEISRSELYMKEICSTLSIDCILKALMQLYSSNLLKPKILEGILVMLSCVPYETVAPDGQVMAMGLLSNKELEVRDRAIQCFEKWNSKKGIPILQSLDCHPRWLQRYVEKVIIYLERDGMD